MTVTSACTRHTVGFSRPSVSQQYTSPEIIITYVSSTYKFVEVTIVNLISFPARPSTFVTAMTNFPIETAQIVALWMECIFYGQYNPFTFPIAATNILRPLGIFLVTFSLCMRILLFMRNLRQSSKGTIGPSPIKWNMILVALAMFVFASFDVAFGLCHNIDAFVYYTGPGGATAEFSLVSNWVNVMKSADFVAQTTIGDAILVCS